jgi:hypothetical protein
MIVTSRKHGLLLGAFGALWVLALSPDLIALATAGTFNPTGTMTTLRSGYVPYVAAGDISPFTATRLNDGTVLVAGGADASGNPVSSAEIYDPSTGTFTPTRSMTNTRTNIPRRS